jgi:hypothetical protein
VSRPPRSLVSALSVGAFTLVCGACYDVGQGQELQGWNSAGEDEGGEGGEGDEGGAAPVDDSGADPSASQGGGQDDDDDDDDAPAAPPSITLLSVNGDAEPAPITEAMAATVAVSTDDDAAVTRVEVSVVGDDAPLATIEAPPFSATWLIDDVVAREPRTLQAIAFGADGVASPAVTLPITFKLPMSGSPRWRRGATDGPASDQVTGVAIASDGDLITVGFQTEPKGERSRVTLSRHSPVDGHSRWQAVLPSQPSHGEHFRGRALAITAEGDVLVAGEVRRGGAPPQLWLGRVDGEDGALLRSREGQSAAGEQARALVTTSAGGAVIVGQSGEDLAGALLLRRYDADLTVRWSRSQKGELTAWSIGQGLCAGEDGSLYVTGSEVSLGGDHKLLVSRYSAEGALLWGSSGIFEGMEREDGAGVALNSLGELVVVGDARGVDEAARAVAVRRLRADDGSLISFIRLSGHSDGDGVAHAVALDRHNRIYIAATLEDGQGEAQGVTVRLSRDSGAIAWIRPHEGAGANEVRGAAVAIDTIGYVFLGGRELVNGTPRWWTAALNP